MMLTGKDDHIWTVIEKGVHSEPRCTLHFDTSVSQSAPSEALDVSGIVASFMAKRPNNGRDFQDLLHI